MLDLPEGCWALLQSLESRAAALGEYRHRMKAADLPQDELRVCRKHGLVLLSWHPAPGADFHNAMIGDPGGEWHVWLTGQGRTALAERRLAHGAPATKEPEKPAREEPKCEEPKPDGPEPPNIFSWGGHSYPGLTSTPWRFVDFLWRQPGRKAKLEDLAEPVLQDRVARVSVSTAGSWRREANRFFCRKGIPWKATITNGVAMLVRSPSGQKSP